MPRIGVLALQGDFAEHLAVLHRLGVEGVDVRLPGELGALDGLIIPGGESTTIAYLMDLYRLRGPIKERAAAGMPIWGTCAGMIVLARELDCDRPKPLGLMDLVVSRNAFGRQVDSFEEGLSMPVLGEEPFPAVFIRAPAIKEVGPKARVLAALSDGTPVAAQQERLLATAFHPELTEDLRFHSYFVNSLCST